MEVGDVNKKMFWFLIILGVIIFVGGPLFVQYNHWPQGSNGNGDWLSFWGSYLGIIPSGLIAFFVSKNETSKQYKNELKKKIDFEDLQRVISINQNLIQLTNRFTEINKNIKLIQVNGLHPLIQPMYDTQGNYTNLVQKHIIQQIIQRIKQNIPLINNHDKVQEYIDKIEDNFQQMESTINTRNEDIFREQFEFMQDNVKYLKKYIDNIIKEIKKLDRFLMRKIHSINMINNAHKHFLFCSEYFKVVL